MRKERTRAADFRIGEVAALVGLSPATIRAWERRHGIVAPGRSRFQHRRYSSDDVETLRRVQFVCQWCEQLTTAVVDPTLRGMIGF